MKKTKTKLLPKFNKKINTKKVKVGIVGLGYVGLNLLCLFSKKK